MLAEIKNRLIYSISTESRFGRPVGSRATMLKKSGSMATGAVLLWPRRQRLQLPADLLLDGRTRRAKPTGPVPTRPVRRSPE
jgi:hypothetical protein